RMDPGSPASARTPQDAQQNSFRLIVSSVCCGDLARGTLSQHRPEQVIAQASSRGLCAQLPLLREERNVSSCLVQLEFVFPGKPRHKLRIGIAFRAANPVIEMHYRKNNTQL